MIRISFCIVYSLIFAFSLPGWAYGLDIIGTGSNQTESINNALRNLSELVSGVHVNSSFRMDKRLSRGKVRTEVRDLFAADSEFYVENIHRFISHASTNRIVLTLSKPEIEKLREAYRVWRLRADVRGQVEYDGNRIRVTLREINGVPVTVQAYRLTVNRTKISWLCSDWREEQRKEFFGILAEPVALNDNRTESFEIQLDGGFNILDIGKRKNINVEKVLIQGVDYLGRKVEAEM
jgi:hypothetical protein